MTPIRLTRYFRHARKEVLAEVPLTARTILDLGCGAGALGEQLRQRQRCEVWGIECDPYAAREARGRLDRVIAATASEAAPALPAAYFDTLIAADILEHLADPWAVLRALAPSLAPGATVILSLPNVQNLSVIRDLLRGRFMYVPAGILDQTHLRFFTRASALELVHRAGCTAERVIPLYNHRSVRRAAQRGDLPHDLPIEHGTTAADFYATQFLIVARAGTPSSPDTSSVRVSIVMLTFNQLPLTQQTITSLRAVTRQPYELIVVDNGSTDGTPAYLDTLEPEGVRVIKNPVNRGVAAGWNQGLRVATGDCLMVVNNDVVVAEGWLERMTRLAYALPQVGLVGCRVSAVSGPQGLCPDYEDVRDFPLFAHRYAELVDGSWFELPRIAAVAMLWRREVYETVRDFDEQFYPANMEDDDYSLRTLAAGYRNVVANDVFLHHAGSASHPPPSAEAKAEAKANGQRFLAKWGAAAAPIVALRFATYDDHLALLAPAQHALPGWAHSDVTPRALARYLAKVGRRFGRYGWRAESLAAFRRSLRTAITLQGVMGFVWNARPRMRVSLPAAPAAIGSGHVSTVSRQDS